MPSLSINEFSCIQDATFELAPITIIIGPQGSGKSITTKILYFCCDSVINFVQSAEQGDSLAEYKRSLARQFVDWFPPSAWGRNRFNINYTSGPFSIRVLRKTSQKSLRDEVTVSFSKWFGNFYNETHELFQKLKNSDDLATSNNPEVVDAIEQVWRLRNTILGRLGRELGSEFISYQTYIPSGRAFFTSIGRLVAGIDQAGSLDPVTIKFARLFANLRDRNTRRVGSLLGRLGDDYLARRKLFMTKLFGGEIKFENEKEFVDTEDGRRIPFSSLSSGQQELLPMWSLMDYFSERDAMRLSGSGRSRRLPRELVYIEEPEAHLFPSAQSLLMEFLIGSISGEQRHRNILITTHSPYIMSKLNVFLKAGNLSRQKKKSQAVSEIVSRDCWIYQRDLAAFAIEDGQLRTLFDEDGLIDATYLDGVSEEISREFSELLEIEMDN